ncbi:MAG: UDP-N-acetylglucosamine 2-epimerase (non-hydrolyzing) [Pseudomonadales bacterium]|nr:UDP-N-acetylglucosamine 2-epimerase (non-hydrolyzing) [Pseudomonadales bacterium]
MKIVTVVGARPQFIKAAAVSRAIASDHAGDIDELIVHTGQHHDDNMSSVFFDELGIPSPRYSLGIAGGTHGAMTGRMLEAIEHVLLKERPDWVLVYGDTNSTLAAALAAAKLHIPLAHVEAGLRSFNMLMPEEVNRIVADRLSTLLFCPTETAVANLADEGLREGVHNVGDVMYDVALYFANQATSRTAALADLGVRPGAYALATCHRAENTDSRERLASILDALCTIATQLPVVLPLHPRTRSRIEQFKLGAKLKSITVTEPLAFLSMVALERDAAVILTDSGGVQKEAFFYRVPCVTMRDETEWVETVTLGWNSLTGADTDAIVNATLNRERSRTDASPYGAGDASRHIVAGLLAANPGRNRP